MGYRVRQYLKPSPPCHVSITRYPGAAFSVAKSPATDVNGIDWMAQQNGGQFDPVLFGDYRDTQNDLLSNDFFSDAFLSQDFNTPFNMPEELSPSEPKKDLMKQVEEQQNAGGEEVVPGEPKQFLTCDKIWSVLSFIQHLNSADVLQGPCARV